MSTEAEYIARRIAYQQNVIATLEKLKQALRERRFDDVEEIDADLRALHLEEEIHFKKENLEVFKKRLDQ